METQAPIRFYQFKPIWGLPNVSPFCMKLEVYFRLAKIPYEAVRHTNIRRAPKGKLPYIEHAGRKIGDSTLIIEYLKTIFGDPLNGNLTASERAQSQAFQRLMEEHLYWIMVYSRWMEEENWVQVKKAFFGPLPPLVRQILPAVIRKKVRRDLYGHGIGRHTREEIYEIGKKDLLALSDFLENKKFFFGDKVSSLDATAYAFIANILWIPLESPLKVSAEQCGNLSDYCKRMKEVAGI